MTARLHESPAVFRTMAGREPWRNHFQGCARAILATLLFPGHSTQTDGHTASALGEYLCPTLRPTLLKRMRGCRVFGILCRRSPAGARSAWILRPANQCIRHPWRRHDAFGPRLVGVGRGPVFFPALSCAARRLLLHTLEGTSPATWVARKRRGRAFAICRQERASCQESNSRGGERESSRPINLNRHPRRSRKPSPAGRIVHRKRRSPPSQGLRPHRRRSRLRRPSGISSGSEPIFDANPRRLEEPPAGLDGILLHE